MHPNIGHFTKSPSFVGKYRSTMISLWVYLNFQRLILCLFPLVRPNCTQQQHLAILQILRADDALSIRKAGDFQHPEFVCPNLRIKDVMSSFRFCWPVLLTTSEILCIIFWRSIACPAKTKTVHCRSSTSQGIAWFLFAVIPGSLYAEFLTKYLDP